MQGHVNLAGVGRSLAQVMGGADGRVVVATTGGSVSSLMVALAGLQLFDALILYVTGDNRIPILCAAGRMNFQQEARSSFDRTILDTQKSILRVNGQVALKSQVVNVEVKAEPKSFDLLDLHGPVAVTGKIRAPQISLGRSFPLPTPVVGTATPGWRSSRPRSRTPRASGSPRCPSHRASCSTCVAITRAVLMRTR